MRLKCFLIKGRLLQYADRELDRAGEQDIEDHLLGCGRCRDRLLSLKFGQRVASSLPRHEPQNDSWPVIEAGIGTTENTEKTDPANGLKRWRGNPMFRPIASSAAMLMLGAIVMAVVQHLISTPAPPSQPAATVASAPFDAREFYPVSIDDIRLSDEPHVVAEGYVSNVSVDKDDGDLTFKLVDRLDRPGPFVICEIMDPIKLAPPAIGSRVKVYGVSRYDAKADHRWYEVHPVIDIEPMPR